MENLRIRALICERSWYVCLIVCRIREGIAITYSVMKLMQGIVIFVFRVCTFQAVILKPGAE